MSNSTLILPAELNHTSREERNQLYMDKYGFTLEEIIYIESIPSGFEKIENITRLIIDHYSKGKINPKYKIYNTKISAQLTLGVIGGLYRTSWDGDYKTATTQVRNLLMRRYQSQLIDSHDLEFRLTTTHLLREEFGVYQGNLIQLSKKYRFHITDYDLKESIKLPEYIGFDEAAFIGIAYAEACLSEENSRTTDLIFRGMDFERELSFYNLITSMLLSQYNYITEVIMIKYTRNEHKFKIPAIYVSSAAIATWFRDHLNFPIGEKRKELKFPNYIKDDISKKGFLCGYIGAKGRIRNDRKHIRIFSSDRDIIYELNKILKELNIDSTISIEEGRLFNIHMKKEYSLFIGKLAIKKMYENGLLINQAHIP